jgi:hypothetical protein
MMKLRGRQTAGPVDEAVKDRQTVGPVNGVSKSSQTVPFIAKL